MEPLQRAALGAERLAGLLPVRLDGTPDRNLQQHLLSSDRRQVQHVPALTVIASFRSFPFPAQEPSCQVAAALPFAPALRPDPRGGNYLPHDLDPG
jgi:hypothetical protein